MGPRLAVSLTDISNVHLLYTLFLDLKSVNSALPRTWDLLIFYKYMTRNVYLQQYDKALSFQNDSFLEDWFVLPFEKYLRKSVVD